MLEEYLNVGHKIYPPFERLYKVMKEQIILILQNNQLAKAELFVEARSVTKVF